MGDQREAGRKADAHKVRDLVRARYSNRKKDAIRSWAVAEVAAVEPALVLDLWGGGRSAEEMTAAGLSVLSVDRADGFREHGVSAMRGERALRICAEEGGYRAGWGSAAKFAPECDAAWLDFMGHLCGETVRVLKACRGMKALVITLMADRMKGAENWATETWEWMYRGAIERYTGLSVRQVRKYQREGGQWVLVFLARGRSYWERRKEYRASRPPASPSDLERKKQRAADPERKARKRIYERARLADPERRERQRESARRWYDLHGEAERAAERARHARYRAAETPEQREIRLRSAREKWATDPAVREMRKATTARYHERHPERVREQQREQHRRTQEDPERHARRLAAARAWRAANPEKMRQYKAATHAKSPRIASASAS